MAFVLYVGSKRYSSWSLRPYLALAPARRVQALWRAGVLASGGPFLFGAFSIADAMSAPVTTRFTTYHVELDATCRAYVETIAALPAMRRWRAGAEAEPKSRS